MKSHMDSKRGVRKSRDAAVEEQAGDGTSCARCARLGGAETRELRGIVELESTGPSGKPSGKKDSSRTTR